MKSSAALSLVLAFALTAACSEGVDAPEAEQARPTDTAVALSFDLSCAWSDDSVSGPTGRIQSVRPDSLCTPGATDPTVTQENYLLLMCFPGHADRVRPPASYLEELKAIQIRWYRISMSPTDLELNYVVPLELGGAPRDPRNIWPAPKTNPYKDTVAATLNMLLRRACNAEITLAEAQTRVVNAGRGGLSGPLDSLKSPVRGANVPPDGHSWYTSNLMNTLYYYCDLDEGWRDLPRQNRMMFESEEALLLEWSARRVKAAESRC